jgi:hypothetical protein
MNSIRSCVAVSVLLGSVFTLPFSSVAHGGNDGHDRRLQGRAEVNWRYGDERSILMTELWAPLAQDDSSVIYGNIRIMGDNQDNREGNLGLGYRKIVNAPVAGAGVAGVHGWFDRRLTENDSAFHQIAVGAEWLGETVDARINGYMPLSDARSVTIPAANPQARLAGTGIVVDTNGTLLEEPQGGFDWELGLEISNQNGFLQDHTDSVRLYGGGYYFDGDNTGHIKGWRGRITADITEDVQIGARVQHDNVRGSQGFLEATIRFPFNAKQSYRQQGLYARLDESPERDVDIVTGAVVTDSGQSVPVINTTTGTAQQVLNVDNEAAGGGDGSVANPFNTLADAQAASSAHGIIYVRRGDGTSANQNQGIVLDKEGQQLIGSGTDFIFDNNQFSAANGAPVSATLIQAAGLAPVITNVNATSDGVTVTADNVTVAGITVDGATRDGIVVRADGAAASAQNVTITDVTTINNRMGVYLHGTDSGAVTAMVQRTVTGSNSQHGIAVYDDTDDTFEVDLGGGSMGSVGRNVLAGNTLEDLAVEYDGRILAAQNNWWGQASGPDIDTPDIGIAPQIYYGAPIHDGLVGHWTFDTEWTTNTTAYDRSGQDNHGTLEGGLSLADQVTGQYRQGLDFDESIGHRVSIGASSIYLSSTNQSITYFSSFNAETITPNGSPDDRLISLRRASASSSLSYGLGLSNNSLYLASGVGTVTANDFNIATNNPETTSLTYDGLTIISYVGINQDSDVRTGSIPASNSDLGYIGAFRPYDRTFNGVIDDTRIYNRALDADEIAELNRQDTSTAIDTSRFLLSTP